MFFLVEPIIIDSESEEEEENTDADLFIVEQEGGSAFAKTLEQIHLLPRSPAVV